MGAPIKEGSWRIHIEGVNRPRDGPTLQNEKNCPSAFADYN